MLDFFAQLLTTTEKIYYDHITRFPLLKGLARSSSFNVSHFGKPRWTSTIDSCWAVNGIMRYMR